MNKHANIKINLIIWSRITLSFPFQFCNYVAVTTLHDIQ